MAFFGLSFFIQRESSFIVNRNLSVKSLNVGNGLEPGDAEGFQIETFHWRASHAWSTESLPWFGDLHSMLLTGENFKTRPDRREKNSKI